MGLGFVGFVVFVGFIGFIGPRKDLSCPQSPRK